jgi:lipopolysaccharide heptosyltransferase II
MNTLSVGQLENAKLLVRVPNWIGDAVLCLPALRELRRVLPGAELVLAGRPWVLDVFPVDELRCRAIPYDTRREDRGVFGRWRFASKLRRENFAAAILFQNAFDAALLAAWSGIPIRAGYSRQARRPLLTHPIAVPRNGETPPHEAYYYLELLRRLGLISGFGEVEEIRLRAAQRDGTAAKHALQEFFLEKFPSSRGLAARVANAELVVGIGAGASFGTAKRWPGERYSELALRLHRELGAASLFFGSGEEAPLAEALLESAGDASVSLAGKTSLQEFIRLAPACDLFITNDTGTMHVASSLGVPVLAIFGPTDERGTRPLGPRAQVITGVAECRPCKLRHCPIDHRCMTSITVDAVFQAARAILELRQPESLRAARACPERT